eukprot:266680-Ditylum_brightwellii.AAC.1
MQQCAKYVKFQLPNELSRVKYLLKSIESGDPMLQASLALIKNDDKPDGKMYDFKRTMAFIIPSDPAARKIKDNKGGTTAE